MNKSKQKKTFQKEPCAISPRMNHFEKNKYQRNLKIPLK